MTAPAAGRLPDFLLIGAPKCGTSSLYHWLSGRPDVHGSRPKEPMFFNRDDVEVHGETVVLELPGEWLAFDWENRRDELLAEYARHFEGVSDDQLAFEGTTKYLASKRAAERVAETLPEAKLIAVLREPVDRVHSHYWHEIRKGKAVHSFEDRLRFETPGLLQFGLYREQLETWLGRFPRERLLVLVFEEMVEDRARTMSEVCEFLGIVPDASSPADERYNPARTPRSPRVQRWLNRLGRYVLNRNRTSHAIGKRFGPDQRIAPLVTRGLSRLSEVEAGYPPMEERTRKILTAYYERENRGLSDLVGKDLSSIWGMDV